MTTSRGRFIVFLITLSFACSEKKSPPQQNRDQPPVVDVIIAKSQEISNLIEVNGSVVANESVELRPEVSGRLVYLNVPEGSYIQKGTVLARINDAELRAQLGKTKAQLQLAEQTQQRLEKLLSIGGVNQADYDVAVNQVNTLQADIVYTQALIDKTVMRAPFDGVVGLRQVSPGAYVTPASIIASMQKMDKLKIDFTLPEEYANTIKKGSTVDVELDESTPENEKAVVIAIEPQVNENTRNILARAVLEKGKANPGAFVKVYVKGDKNKNGIMVPTNSIIPDAIKKKVVLVKNGKAVFTDVETGLRKESAVEITSGINTGDTVVITGVLFAKPDKPVKVRSVKQQEEMM